MRSGLLAIATALALGLGVKLVFVASPTAHANVDAVRSPIQVRATLPVQKVHDMTFVFTEAD